MKLSKGKNVKNRTKKIVHSVDGEALDQETIIRLRPIIQDYVKNDLNVYFKYSKLIWNKNKENDNFNFIINFYG